MGRQLGRHSGLRGWQEVRTHTREDDVGNPAVARVAELLWVLQASMAPAQAHHGGLGIVECGAWAVQAAGADGVLQHVELLQLRRDQERP